MNILGIGIFALIVLIPIMISGISSKIVSEIKWQKRLIPFLKNAIKLKLERNKLSRRPFFTIIDWKIKVLSFEEVCQYPKFVNI